MERVGCVKSETSAQLFNYHDKWNGDPRGRNSGEILGQRGMPRCIRPRNVRVQQIISSPSDGVLVTQSLNLIEELKSAGIVREDAVIIVSHCLQPRLHLRNL